MTVKIKKMHERLRQARKNAGFSTTIEAINRFSWRPSTYRAHENGQNPFKAEDALTYARAYGVSPGWLLTGENTAPEPNYAAGRGKTSQIHGKIPLQPLLCPYHMFP